MLFCIRICFLSTDGARQFSSLNIGALVDSACINVTHTYSVKVKAAPNTNTPTVTLQPRYKAITILFRFKSFNKNFAFSIHYFKVNFIICFHFSKDHPIFSLILSVDLWPPTWVF